MRSSLLFVMALAACGGSKDDDTPAGTTPTDTPTDTVDSDTPTTDTTDTVDTDTTTPAPEVSDVAVTIAPQMGTVVTIAWAQSFDSDGYVEFGEDGDLTRSTRVLPSSGGVGEALLVGLPPDTEISYRVVAGGEAQPTETFTTGSLPNAPTMTVEGEQDRFFALPLIDGSSTATVIDPKGRVVWMHEDTRNLSIFRVHVLKDGSGIAYTATLTGSNPNPNSVLVKLSWDLTTEEVIEIPYMGHDFYELDDGRIVTLAYEWRDKIEGNKLTVLDTDGTQTDIWSAWDCYDPAVNESIDLEHGWTHANALDYDPTRDAFLVGMRNLTTIAQVEWDGTCTWGFGGSGGTVDISGAKFYHQHQFTRLDGGLLVFDNDGATGLESRVIEYAFDEVAGTASVERIIRADPPLHTFILGDAHRLDDGDTVITWSVPSTIDRVAPDDTNVFRMVADQASLTFGFTEVLVDPGRPEAGISR